jgi:hypothetical protein
LLYLLGAIIAPIGLLLIPSRLIVGGDAAATADNIRASESLFRIGIASELIHQVIFIFLVLALYRLFKVVDQKLAVLMVPVNTTAAQASLAIERIAEPPVTIMIPTKKSLMPSNTPMAHVPESGNWKAPC